MRRLADGNGHGEFPGRPRALAPHSPSAAEPQRGHVTPRGRL